MTSRLRYASLIGLGILTGGISGACYHLQPVTIPLETLEYNVAGATDLFVLLPGLGDYASAFEERGLVTDLARIELGPDRAADVVAVNAHFKYYRDRSFVDRLRADVVAPALARYERVHLVGISLGGFGALLYLRDHPSEVATVTAIAPYVGDEEFYGFLEGDAPPVDESTSDADNPWPWFQDVTARDGDRIYLGFGDRDKFARGHRALATLLDSEHVVVRPGKHRWTVWRTIWPELFARLGRAEAELASAPVTR